MQASQALSSISSATHLIVGGSGILGYALSLRLAAVSESSKIFLTSRNQLPSYFYHHTTAIHVPFCDHTFTSITSLLLDLQPTVIWFFLSDNDNSDSASLSSSILTNISPPTSWLSALVQTSPLVHFFYASSSLAANPLTSCYSATKATMSSFLLNPIVADRINFSIFYPASLVGPGERSSTRLIPSVLNSLSTYKELPSIPREQSLSYIYSLELASNLLDNYYSNKPPRILHTLQLESRVTVGDFFDSIIDAFTCLSILPKHQILSEYSSTLSLQPDGGWWIGIRMSVLHFLLYG